MTRGPKKEHWNFWDKIYKALYDLNIGQLWGKKKRHPNNVEMVMVLSANPYLKDDKGSWAGEISLNSHY